MRRLCVSHVCRAFAGQQDINLSVEFIPFDGDETKVVSPFALQPLAQWELNTNTTTATTYVREDGQLKFSTQINNCPESAYLVVALYDKERMVGVKMQHVRATEPVQSVFNDCTFDKAKVMLMESFSSLKQLTVPEIL